MSSNLKYKYRKLGEHWSEWIYDIELLKNIEFDEMMVNEQMTSKQYEEFKKKFED